MNVKLYLKTTFIQKCIFMPPVRLTLRVSGWCIDLFQLLVNKVCYYRIYNRKWSKLLVQKAKCTLFISMSKTVLAKRECVCLMCECCHWETERIWCVVSMVAELATFWTLPERLTTSSQGCSRITTSACTTRMPLTCWPTGMTPTTLSSKQSKTLHIKLNHVSRFLFLGAFDRTGKGRVEGDIIQVYGL